MEWLSQNWIWVVAAIIGFFLITRMRGGGHGMGHSMGHAHGSGGGSPPADRGVGSDTAFDPVSRRAVAAGGSAISSIYGGRAYYFESRENRDAFESSPEKYIAASPEAGQAIGSKHAHGGGRRRRRGC